jgi:Fic family protein
LLAGEDLADAADAERAIMALNMGVAPLANTEALARVLLRAEAVASSRIEGLIVGARRLLAADVAQRAGLPASDDTAAEILANIEAMNFAIESVDPQRPITRALLLEAHCRLLGPTMLGEYAGELRQQQNWIGRNAYNPIDADFVPPPPELVSELFDDLCAFCNEDSLPAVAQAAIAHAQFETIHPFVDGNGRIGRALVQMILRRRGLAQRVIPPVSLVLATRSRDYIAGLTAARYVGDASSSEAIKGISQWVGVFSAACTRSVADAGEYEKRIRSIQDAWRERVGPLRSDAAALKLLDMLPGAPVTTVALASQYLGRSTPTAVAAIKQLVDAEVLHPMRVGRQRGQVFEAKEIIAAFTLLERQLGSPSGDTLVAHPRARYRRARFKDSGGSNSR